MKTDNPVDASTTDPMLIYITQGIKSLNQLQYNFSLLYHLDTHKILPYLKIYNKQINTWKIYATKKARLNDSNSLVSVLIHLKPGYFWPKKEGYSMKYEVISLKCTELRPKRNNLTGVKTSFNSSFSRKEQGFCNSKTI